MASQDPEAWEAYISLFALADYQFTPTDQLPQQPLWQESPEEIERDPETSSGDKADFAIETNGESRGVAEEDDKEVDKASVEHVTQPIMSHSLLVLPKDSQSLRLGTHSRHWKLPFRFVTGPRVHPPQGCTDTCTYARHGKGCASTNFDPGALIEDQWEFFFLIFEQFFTKEVLDIMLSNTNQYAAGKNTGVPGPGQQS